MTALIELRDIRKSFGPVEVLKGVDLEVHPGRVSALVGDNGAGKSTLIKGLAGVQSYDAGEVLFDGQPASLSSPHDASALGIEVVYQDLALCENLDIVQNMFLGREEQHHRMLNGPQMERHAAETLGSLSVRTIKSVRQKVSSLSGGQRQTVAIARSVLQKARLVILDEPTAALGVAQTEQVLQLVRRLADSGVGVLIISHNLADVFAVADYVDVLYLGQMVAHLDSKSTSRDDVVGYITLHPRRRSVRISLLAGHHVVARAPAVEAHSRGRRRCKTRVAGLNPLQTTEKRRVL
jgi:D-xylose transport system ATP-binding protein